MAGLSKVTGSGLATGAATDSLVGIDDNATSTAITIDANENVGIGTSSPSAKLDVAGTAVFGTGKLRDTGGDISINQGNFGLRINDSASAITATNGGGSNSDATTDLGISSIRFKNLYLSGGVRLGGTGTANSLDDYETGTWTPGFAFTGASVGITYSSQAGFYTKVGNLVTVQCNMGLTSKGTSVGAARITGLPFTVSNTTGAQPAGNIHFGNILITGMVTAYSDLNQTTMNLRKISDAGANDSLKNTDCSNNTGIIITMSYRV